MVLLTELAELEPLVELWRNLGAKFEVAGSLWRQDSLQTKDIDLVVMSTDIFTVIEVVTKHKAPCPVELYCPSNEQYLKLLDVLRQERGRVLERD